VARRLLLHHKSLPFLYQSQFFDFLELLQFPLMSAGGLVRFRKPPDTGLVASPSFFFFFAKRART
jgi:hypothetical protein